MRFSTITLGCKVNQFETQAMEYILISRGHTLVKIGEGSDVCIINTCTITENGASKSRKAIKGAKSREPDAKIAVCGCLAQYTPDDMLSMGADLVGGSGKRREFALMVEEMINDKPLKAISHELFIAADSIEQLPAGLAPDKQHYNSTEKTRALLKIQDGCDNFCAYCVVPYVRGRSRSLTVSNIRKQAESLSKQGYREIVITGIEISSYGKDLGDNVNLIKAISVISENAPNSRIRLGSLDPRVISEAFCEELCKIDNLCDHFHLSVQSGCDDILRSMGRKYAASDVLDAVSLLRKYYYNCGITADLIVGFPGETDEDFKKTLDFIEKAAFSDMHIFPFSKMRGVLAETMANQVSKTVKLSRVNEVAALARELTRNFKQSQIGKALDVLFEQKLGGAWVGYSSNYIKTAVNASDISGFSNYRNRLGCVQISAIKDDLLLGDVTDWR